MYVPTSWAPPVRARPAAEEEQEEAGARRTARPAGAGAPEGEGRCSKGPGTSSKPFFFKKKKKSKKVPGYHLSPTAAASSALTC